MRTVYRPNTTNDLYNQITSQNKMLVHLITIASFIMCCVICVSAAAEVWSLKSQFSRQNSIIEKIDYSLRRVENIIVLNSEESDGEYRSVIRHGDHYHYIHDRRVEKDEPLKPKKFVVPSSMMDDSRHLSPKVKNAIRTAHAKLGGGGEAKPGNPAER